MKNVLNEKYSFVQCKHTDKMSWSWFDKKQLCDAQNYALPDIVW